MSTPLASTPLDSTCHERRTYGFGDGHRFTLLHQGDEDMVRVDAIDSDGYLPRDDAAASRIDEVAEALAGLRQVWGTAWVLDEPGALGQLVDRLGAEVVARERTVGRDRLEATVEALVADPPRTASLTIRFAPDLGQARIDRAETGWRIVTRPRHDAFTDLPRVVDGPALRALGTALVTSPDAPVALSLFEELA